MRKWTKLGAKRQTVHFQKTRQFTGSPMFLMQCSSSFNDYFIWIWVICGRFPMDRERYIMRIFWYTGYFSAQTFQFLLGRTPFQETHLRTTSPQNQKVCSKTSFPPKEAPKRSQKKKTCFVGSSYFQRLSLCEFLQLFLPAQGVPPNASSEVSNGIATELLLNHRASRP